MILTNEFQVGAPVDRVWGLMDELENVIPCMPGAAYIGREGDDHKVSIKVKVGAISANFQGTMRFVEKSDATHVAVIHGAGKDLGGKASAVAKILARLEALSPELTRVVVETDLAMTGRLAQFGGGVIADISSRMIAQFTENLHKAIIARPEFPDSSAATAPSNPKSQVSISGTRGEEPVALDLVSVMGLFILKRVFKYVAMPLGVFVLGWLVGRFF